MEALRWTVSPGAATTAPAATRIGAVSGAAGCISSISASSFPPPVTRSRYQVKEGAEPETLNGRVWWRHLKLWPLRASSTLQVEPSLLPSSTQSRGSLEPDAEVRV
jgi:hypothetical protein